MQKRTNEPQRRLEEESQNPQPAEPVKTRKAFICTSCEGVYADEPVTQCDCMPEQDDFIEGVIIYPSAEPVKVPSNDDLLTLIRDHAFRQYEFDELMAFARALLTRYGQPTEWQDFPKCPGQ